MWQDLRLLVLERWLNNQVRSRETDGKTSPTVNSSFFLERPKFINGHISKTLHLGFWSKIWYTSITRFVYSIGFPQRVLCCQHSATENLWQTKHTKSYEILQGIDSREFWGFCRCWKRFLLKVKVHYDFVKTCLVIAFWREAFCKSPFAGLRFTSPATLRTSCWQLYSRSAWWERQPEVEKTIKNTQPWSTDIGG